MKSTGLSDTLIHPDVIKWWIDKGMAVYKKYALDVTDLLIFDSHVPRCAVEPNPRQPSYRGRLGMLGGAVPRELVDDANRAKRIKHVGMQYRRTGQGILDANGHMLYPTSLFKLTPDDWPPQYQELRRKRQAIQDAGVPWCAALPSDKDTREAENKRLAREFLGIWGS